MLGLPILPGPKLSLGYRMLLPLVYFPFLFGRKELSSHVHIMGLTGQGKSKLLAHMTAQLIMNGRACSLIDPHADLAHDVLHILLDKGYFRRQHAYNKLLYIDFARRDRFLPFNVLNQPYSTAETARLIVEVCTRAWPSLADGNAPQFENTLLASAVVLVTNKLPLTALTKLLTDKSYRDRLLANVTDMQVVSFFKDRFDRWGREAPMLIESTLRRVFLLSFTPVLRHSLGQNENVLNFRALMDSQTSVIFNLGGLDEQTQRLLGCFLTVGMEVAALSRADIPEYKRSPYHLILDEFSMFSAQSEEALARVLSLARKYGLFLTMAHQTWSQLSARLQGAMQNTIQIAFRLGRQDAVWAAPRFGAYNPMSIKHLVRDEDAEERTHPVFYSVQETYEGWAKALETLKPRHAYLRVGKKTVKIKTAKVPRFRSNSGDLQRVQDYYAEKLMRPAPVDEEREPIAQSELSQVPEMPFRRKVPL